MIIQMQVIGGGDKVERLGWRLWALLVKTAQQSLDDEDGQSGLTVTVRRVWLSCRKKLRSF